MSGISTEPPHVGINHFLQSLTIRCQHLLSSSQLFSGKLDMSYVRSGSMGRFITMDNWMGQVKRIIHNCLCILGCKLLSLGLIQITWESAKLTDRHGGLKHPTCSPLWLYHFCRTQMLHHFASTTCFPLCLYQHLCVASDSRTLLISPTCAAFMLAAGRLIGLRATGGSLLPVGLLDLRATGGTGY